MSKKSFSLMSWFLCGVCILGLLSCTKKSPTEKTDALELSGQKGKTFVYCSEGPPSSFNPQLETDGATFNVTASIYSKLVTFEYGTTNVIANLAEKWEVDSKGLEYTFDLRKGVKFHTTSYFTPTRDLNADDVIWSFQRQSDPKHPYHEVGGAYEYFNAMDMASIIKNIEKINDHRVKFVLSKPQAPFLANLAMGFASIFSKEYADQLLEAKTPGKIDHEPIGTGPFQFVSYQKDALVRLQAFDNYFDKAKRGNIQTLLYAITPDASVRLQKLRSDECQLMIYPDPADLEAIRRSKNLELLNQPGFNVAYLAMNVKKKPFDNKLVRQAFNHALNKKAYIQGVYMGNAQVAKNPMPPILWGYHEGIQDYDHNLEKAKELLNKAGFPNGFETDIWIIPIARPYLPSGKKLAEMMQDDLAKVNIQAKLTSFDWPTYLEKGRNKEHVLMQHGWTGDNGDPDNFLHALLSCNAVEQGINYAAWCHKPFDDLVNMAQRSTNRKERTDLYKKAQEIFHAEAPWVPLAHSMVYRAMRQGISGYKMTPVGRDIFEFITVPE